MNVPSSGDYQWLVGPEGQATLAEAASFSGSLVARARRLRSQHSADRTHLILQQLELRQRAAAKFTSSERMFFTSRGLEQATDQVIAQVKAERFPAGGQVADLCCGIGGDLMALARRTRVEGVDIDPVMATLADANCRSAGTPPEAIHVEAAERFDLAAFDAWHMDPDRRMQGGRTSQLAFSQPSADALQPMLAACPHAAIKLAPAGEVTADLSGATERQWFGSRGECRQQVVWGGKLAQHPGQHAATVVATPPQDAATLVGQPDQPIELVSEVRQYVYEPHAAVIAARLTGELACQENFVGLAFGIAYLTSDQRHCGPLWSSFEVIDVVPFDPRRLRKYLQQHRISRVEVKKRGVPMDPLGMQKQLQKRLRGVGDGQATLLIMPGENGVRTIVARRVDSAPRAYDGPTARPNR